jgi:hypothetical protein
VRQIANPIFIAGDGLEYGARYLVSANGGSRLAEDLTGMAVGYTSYVVIGTVVGGPVGGTIGAGMYFGGKAIGTVIDGVYSFLFR